MTRRNSFQGAAELGSLADDRSDAEIRRRRRSTFYGGSTIHEGGEDEDDGATDDSSIIGSTTSEGLFGFRSSCVEQDDEPTLSLPMAHERFYGFGANQITVVDVGEDVGEPPAHVVSGGGAVVVGGFSTTSRRSLLPRTSNFQTTFHIFSGLNNDAALLGAQQEVPSAQRRASSCRNSVVRDLMHVPDFPRSFARNSIASFSQQGIRVVGVPGAPRESSNVDPSALTGAAPPPRGSALPVPSGMSGFVRRGSTTTRLIFHVLLSRYVRVHTTVSRTVHIFYMISSVHK